MASVAGHRTVFYGQSRILGMADACSWQGIRLLVAGVSDERGLWAELNWVRLGVGFQLAVETNGLLVGQQSSG